MKLYVGHLPLLKDMLVKKCVSDLQLECKQEGDYQGIAILECVKLTKAEYWCNKFLLHCGMSIEEADRWMKTLPKSCFPNKSSFQQ